MYVCDGHEMITRPCFSTLTHLHFLISCALFFSCVVMATIPTQQKPCSDGSCTPTTFLLCRAMNSTNGHPQVRFDAHQMCHQALPLLPSATRGGKAAHPSNVVHDDRFGTCLVWRPVEGPPLPRRYSTAASFAASHTPASRCESSLPVASLQPASPAQNQCPLPVRTGNQLALSSSAHVAPAPAPARRHDPDALLSPPRGSLLRRGKGGIDDVLKNAREAQSLFYSLQERRLKAEYRSTQRELKAELDQQLRYKRMLKLSAYQEELVNLYGPTMRDIIADVFFDDGSDPVLALLKEKRKAPLSQEQALTAPCRPSAVQQPSPQLWVRPDEGGPPSWEADVDAHREHASKEREMLQRALDERRAGRRTNY
jgi:hypothetical protein